MNCTSCGTETNGIKLNGKTFCPVCGEAISQLTPNEALSEVTQSPTAKIINEQTIVSEVDLLKAEEEVLDLLENNKQPIKEETKEEPKDTEIPESNLEIGMTNRVRIGHHKAEELPIKEDSPKSETPQEMPLPEITEPQDLRYPLLDKEELSDIQKKREKKKEILSSYLKSKVKVVSAQKPKKNKKKKDSKIKLLIVFLLLVLVVGIGLVFYVNVFIMSPNKSREIVSGSISFSLDEPGYIPFGYKFAYLEKMNQDKAAYHYLYISNPNKKLTVIEGSGAEKDVYNEYVRNIAGAFVEFEQGEIKYWYINENTLVFKHNLLYQIESSVTMSKEELLKIAEGLIENNDLSG